jgi:hypothetical protein
LIPPIPNLVSILVVLAPIGIYCVVIARINRRQQPLMVSGIWDCIGMLLGLSGFLLFAIPSTLTDFNYTPRDIWLYVHYGNLKGLGHHWWLLLWTFLWFVYLVVLFGGSFLLIWHRRRVTSIYNIDAAGLNDAIQQTLHRVGLEGVRDEKRIFLARSPDAVARGNEVLPVSAASHVVAVPFQDCFVDVNPWPALRHVTLHWSTGAEPLRPAFERELKRTLANVTSRPNPAGNWLMTAGACVFTVMFLLTVLLQIERMRQGKL